MVCGRLCGGYLGIIYPKQRKIYGIKGNKVTILLYLRYDEINGDDDNPTGAFNVEITSYDRDGIANEVLLNTGVTNETELIGLWHAVPVTVSIPNNTDFVRVRVNFTIGETAYYGQISIGCFKVSCYDN